jgi:Tfp pilus assembly protein PilN
MQAVNLLPADARVSTSRFSSVGSGLKSRKTLQIGGAVTVVLAVLVVALFVHERSVVHSKRSELATDQARLVAVQAQVDTVRAAEEAASARTSAVQGVVDSRMNWDRTLNDLARVLPADIVLTTLQASAPVTAAAAAGASATTPDAAPAPAAGSSTLTIAGNASSYVRVAAALDRLALLPWLSGVTLQSTSKSPGSAATFSVIANVAEVH